MEKRTNGLVKLDPESPLKTLDLEKARKVLEAVRDTDERKFTVRTDLSRVGEYTTDDVRGAFVVIAKDIVGSPRSDWPKVRWDKGNFNIDPYGSVKKRANSGWATLDLAAFQNTNDDYFEEPYMMTLAYYAGGETEPDPLSLNITMAYAWPQPPHFTEKGASERTAFVEAVRSGIEATPASHLRRGRRGEEGSTMLTYRKLFRGMRWLADNLLLWRTGNFTLPEQLDNPRLPKPINPS